MEGFKNLVIAATGAVGGWIAWAVGGWDGSMVTLLIMMGIDFLTGLILGWLGRSPKTERGGLSSTAGWIGLAKKVVTFLLVIVAKRLDEAIGTGDLVRNAVIIAFMVNEVISIIENAGLLGIPIPKIFLHAIDLLKNKAEKIEKEMDKDGRN